jgi:hypothetical protein
MQVGLKHGCVIHASHITHHLLLKAIQGATEEIEYHPFLHHELSCRYSLSVKGVRDKIYETNRF